MRPRVKICGLTRAQDVQVALQAGADALGFVLTESPRRIELSQLKALVAEVPPPVARVAVLVDPSRSWIEALLPWVDWVQLHGDETPEFCRLFPGRVIKALRMRQKETLHSCSRYRDAVGAFLFDAYSADAPGGTGKTFRWDWLDGFDPGRPYFLSGGLHSDNVKAAVERLAPYGIDVSSGVEVSPGVKDPDLLRRFLRAAR